MSFIFPLVPAAAAAAAVSVWDGASDSVAAASLLRLVPPSRGRRDAAPTKKRGEEGEKARNVVLKQIGKAVGGSVGQEGARRQSQEG